MRTISIILSTLLSVGIANAQVPVTPPAAVVPPPSVPVKPDDKDKPKPIKEVLPDAQKIDGLFTFYKKKDTLFLEIKPGNLNQDYLICTAVAQGNGTTTIGGMTLKDHLWTFRKENDKIQVVRRQIYYKNAMKNAYSDTLLYAVPIVATGESGGDVVDMSVLPFKSGAIAGIGLNNTTWTDVKGFPNNMEFRVKGTKGAGSAGSRMSARLFGDSNAGNVVTLHYSITKLPPAGYQSRVADPRIGYFAIEEFDFSKNQKDDHRLRYITRWNLQKQDPAAKLSPPKKPIIYWIEKSVPPKYRNAVREGILEWNKAFEKVGIINAIEVRQQQDTDTWDAEDVNYTTFRWITADAGFAMGPSRVNPLTGEIIDADIIFDASWIDTWQNRFDWQVSRNNGQADTEMQPEQKAFKLFERFNKPLTDEQEHVHSCRCNCIEEKSSQLAMLWLALMADDENKDEKPSNGLTPKQEKTDAAQEKTADAKEESAKDDKPKTESEKQKEETKKKKFELFDKFVQEGIKDVVMHEVGHTLGLRHNFHASTWLTLDEMNSPDRLKEYGIAGSVMDYLAINLQPKGKPQGDYFMSTLGPYDYLAIEYGYSEKNDPKELAKIAARQSEKGNHYAADEDVGDDPRVLRRDLGTNPLDFAKVVLERYQQFVPEILDRSVREDGSYIDLGRYYTMLLHERLVSNTALAAVVANNYKNKDRKGDKDARPPVQVVSAKERREAVKWLCENTFKADSIKIAPEVYNLFSEEKWLAESDGNQQFSRRGMPALNRLIATVQATTLFELVNPDTLATLADTAFRVKDGEDILTADELFEMISAAVFSELDTKINIPIARRTLQSIYFDMLASYATGQDDSDLTGGQAAAQLQLDAISSKIDAIFALKAQLDSSTSAHLLSLSRRIKTVLDAKVTRQQP